MKGKISDRIYHTLGYILVIGLAIYFFGLEEGFLAGLFLVIALIWKSIIGWDRTDAVIILVFLPIMYFIAKQNQDIATGILLGLLLGVPLGVVMQKRKSIIK